MGDTIYSPEFARLTDYVGIWAIADAHAQRLFAWSRSPDFISHIRQQPPPLKSQMEMLPQASGKSIAAVRLSGVLMKSQASFGGTSTVMVRREIRQAARDPEVGAILLLIDSPGGTVAGTKDLADDIRAAGRLKPVWAQAEDLMASAAFWAGCQAAKVFANNETAMIGSIGTLQVIDDVSKAAEEQGIKTLVFRTGPLKGLGTPGDPITDEQQVHVQGLVNAVQSSFDAAVRRGRSMSATALAAVRHGGVMVAEEAVAAGLIDGIQPLSKTLSELAKEMGAKTRADRGAAATETIADLLAGPEDDDDDDDDDAPPPVAAAPEQVNFPTITRQLVGLPTLRR